MTGDEHQGNFGTFRDCISGPVIQRLLSRPARVLRSKTAKNRKNGIKSAVEVQAEGSNEAADLSDFVDYLAAEIFESLTQELQSLSFPAVQKDSRLAQSYGDSIDGQVLEGILSTIPSSVADSLETYAILPDPSDLPKFLTPIFQDYINNVTSPPPVWSATRASACEICDRSWIPLTYHHLVPKQIHAKAIKRGWHEEWRLNSVAWLCRACHSYVHRVASNEELGKDYYSVERLLGREDVLNWAKWVGRVRWKAR